MKSKILTVVLGIGSAMPLAAHASVTLTNDQGASAPCIGIGPIGGPAAERCAQMFEQQGFVRNAAAGSSGLTIGVDPADDDVVTRVDLASPAAVAGLAVGDRVLTIDGRSVTRSPGVIAAERLFGRRGETISLAIRRMGADVNVDLTRGPEAAPPGPKWDSMLVANRLLVNWQGRFIPCVGIGPLAVGLLAFCSNHFKPYGFIEATALGGTGVHMDMVRQDSAVIAAVEGGSPAAGALQPGDQIVAINGRVLTASVGQSARSLLFGAAGTRKAITVKRGESEKTFEFTLSSATHN